MHHTRREVRGARRGVSLNGGDAHPDARDRHRGREPWCRSFYLRDFSHFFLTPSRRPRAALNPPRARSPISPSLPSTRRGAAGVRDGRAARDVSKNGAPREGDTDLERRWPSRLTRSVDNWLFFPRFQTPLASSNSASFHGRRRALPVSPAVFPTPPPLSGGDTSADAALPSPGHLSLRAHL